MSKTLCLEGTVKRQISGLSVMLKDQEHREARSDLRKEPRLLGSLFEMEVMPPLARYHPAQHPH